MTDPNLGLVLSGGGARGAYQAGALLAIAEITRQRELPFSVLSGSSAGSINVTYLGARADDFAHAARDLADLWTTLESRHVFRTDTTTLAKTAAEWVVDLGLGGCLGARRGKALLDTTPLRQLLSDHLDMRALSRHIERGRLRGVGVTATSYESGLGVTFFAGVSDIEPWSRVTRLGVRASLGVDHVLASSAIPVFFPAVALDGDWFADGSIRLNTPLSPAIRMGASRIVAIAVRPATGGVVPSAFPAPADPYPTLAETGGVLLNALFLDALEADVETALRINHTLKFVRSEALARHVVPLRPVEVLVLRPSCDPGTLVLHAIDRFPSALRHMFRGLGASEEHGWELLSYLAFDGVYTTRLCELGYQDTLARADEITAFLSPRPPGRDEQAQEAAQGAERALTTPAL